MTATKQRRVLTTKGFALAALIVALLLAGVVSYYASASPDGLNRVAADKGFSGQEKESATSESPFAGYATEWIDNERVSGALAGAVGVGVVLLIAGGVAYVVRRRPGDSTTSTEA